jgi:antitoxin ParD1/3/4
MKTRNVVPTDHQDSMIEGLVGSGRYQNASEVLREGLRLIEAREQREAAQLKALQEAARIGFADLDAGRYQDVPDKKLDGYIADLGRRAREEISGLGQ